MWVIRESGFAYLFKNRELRDKINYCGMYYKVGITIKKPALMLVIFYTGLSHKYDIFRANPLSWQDLPPTH